MITQVLIRMNRAQVKFFWGALVLALLAVFLPACTNSADEKPAATTEQTAAAAEDGISLNRFATPQDVEMDHYVAAIDEALFIGVAVSPQDADNEDARTVAVYLCDGETVSQWIIEEVTGKEATLVAGDTSVDVTIADDSVSGAVVSDGGEPRPFTASRATGDAGLYRAEWTLAGIDYRIDWIVLADGRQRGGLDGKGNDIPPPPPPRIVN